MWYAADVVCELVDQFSMRHTGEWRLVCDWVTAMVGLFAVQIKELTVMRDRVFHEWQSHHPKQVIYRDKRLEILSIYDLVPATEPQMS